MHVAHHAAHIMGQAYAGYFPVQDGLDQLFLRTLGIAHLQDRHGKLIIVGNCRLHLGDGVGFVGLNAYDPLGSSDGLNHGQKALHHLVGPFGHEAVVAGQVRFTLRPVDQDGVHGLRRVQLDMGGKACTSHAHDSSISYRLADGTSRQLPDVGMLLGTGRLVTAIIFDHHTQRFSTAGQRSLFNGQHLP